MMSKASSQAKLVQPGLPGGFLAIGNGAGAAGSRARAAGLIRIYSKELDTWLNP